MEAKIKCPPREPNRYEYNQVVIKVSNSTTLLDIQNYLRQKQIIDQDKSYTFRSDNDGNGLPSETTLSSLNMSSVELECYQKGKVIERYKNDKQQPIKSEQKNQDRTRQVSPSKINQFKINNPQNSSFKKQQNKILSPEKTKFTKNTPLHENPKDLCQQKHVLQQQIHQKIEVQQPKKQIKEKTIQQKPEALSIPLQQQKPVEQKLVESKLENKEKVSVQLQKVEKYQLNQKLPKLIEEKPAERKLLDQKPVIHPKLLKPISSDKHNDIQVFKSLKNSVNPINQSFAHNETKDSIIDPSSAAVINSDPTVQPAPKPTPISDENKCCCSLM